jgi:pimeloyl-ACP methyl ester carboxylesterase
LFRRHASVPRDGFLTAPTTGLEIRYREWGELGDDPARAAPIVLLHGLASTCRIYDWCAPILARTRHVVAYDQRGHGETAKPEGGYETETFVADGVGMAQALHLPVPYVVVGHSWGATIALEWAVRFPDLVRAVVLVDGAIFPFRETPGATWESISARLAPPDLSALTLDALRERAKSGLGFVDESSRNTYLQALFYVRDDGTIRPRLSREKHMRILRTMWEEDVDAAFAALRCPALALLAERAPDDAEGQQMDSLRRGMAGRLQQEQPQLTVHWLRDTIHDVPLQRPAELAEAILSMDA